MLYNFILGEDICTRSSPTVNDGDSALLRVEMNRTVTAKAVTVTYFIIFHPRRL